MGANFNLGVQTFTPRTQKCIITGVYVELALPNLSSPCCLPLPQNPLTVYILQTPTQLTQRTIRSTHPFCHASPLLPWLASLVYRKNLHKVRINYAVKKVIIPYLQYSDETRGGDEWQRDSCASICPVPALLLLLLCLCCCSQVCVCLGRM